MGRENAARGGDTGDASGIFAGVTAASNTRSFSGVTRLAPSPTGALHLGNVRTFLVNWAMARSRGWKVVLRIEDLDGPRVKTGAVEDLIDTLGWLGMDWDEGPLVQSDDLSPYVGAMSRLARAGLAFPSNLTRGEIEAAASAPQEGAFNETRFPPELRPAGLGPREFDEPESGWRFVTPPGEVRFEDEFRGPCGADPSGSVGDFVVWTKRGQPSYQLAVVVDDARQGVTNVVRGDDLLDSAARQTLLYRALGIERVPVWCHLPLVVGEDGRRLAKRHGDTRAAFYRGLGVPAERLVALMARWSGIGPRAESMTAGEFAGRFDLASMTRERVVFTAEQDRWLRQRA